MVVVYTCTLKYMYFFGVVEALKKPVFPRSRLQVSQKLHQQQQQQDSGELFSDDSDPFVDLAD